MKEVVFFFVTLIIITYLFPGCRKLSDSERTARKLEGIWKIDKIKDD